MMTETQINPQEAFLETLAALEERRKPELSLVGPRLKDFRNGFIRLQDFKRAPISVCAHVALDMRAIVVTIGHNLEPVLIVAPESQIELPSNAFIHEGISNRHSGQFISLSLPEPFASDYRANKDRIRNRDKNIEYTEQLHDGKLLGSGVYWRQRFADDRAAIVAKFGTASIRSNVPKPN